MRLKHSIFVTLEILCGLGFGLLGSYLFSFFDKSDITASVFRTFVIFFVVALMGVILVGFFHFRTIGRLSEFGKSIVWCFLGLLTFLVLYFIIDELPLTILPHYVSSVILPMVMPVIGAVIGLNYTIILKGRGSGRQPGA